MRGTYLGALRPLRILFGASSTSLVAPLALNSTSMVTRRVLILLALLPSAASFSGVHQRAFDQSRTVHNARRGSTRMVLGDHPEQAEAFQERDAANTPKHRIIFMR
jgi:hypothetical protein